MSRLARTVFAHALHRITLFTRVSSLICVASAALLFASAALHAQPWPAKPIRYIVPFPAGGSTDLISRHLAEKLPSRLGTPVVIENLGGAGGAIGLARVMQAPADGYTIGLGNSATHTILPHLLIKVPFDASADFTPISLLAEYTNVLVVNTNLPARNLKEFLALAKSRPGVMTYASAGTGSSNRLTSELLAKQAGVRFTHVPYKGNAPALADVVGGHIDWMFATVSEVRAFVQAGRLRALGISGRTRDALLPDVPPLADTLRDFEVVGFMALFGPARLPAPIVERLNAEVKAILGAPDMLERLAALGMQARSSSPEELATRIRTDSALWKSVITAAGISPE